MGQEGSSSTPCLTPRSRRLRTGSRCGLVSSGENPRLSEGRVRNLTVEDLNLDPPQPAAAAGSAMGTVGGGGAASAGTPKGDTPVPLPEGDALLKDVRALLLQFGGVIFAGPPGTSKSHFAA